MLWALASTAFFMGLMGGTHCLVMCAAPCAALTGKGAAPAGDTRVVRLAPQAVLVVAGVLDDALRQAEALLIARLGSIALADLARQFDAECVAKGWTAHGPAGH